MARRIMTQARSAGSGIVGAAHQKFVHGRRVRVLAGHLASLLPKNAAVLDVGCGDGAIDRQILGQRPDVSIEGVDVLVRPQTAIRVHTFDGVSLPFPPSSFDVVMFVDVLHHTLDPRVLLREAGRVAKITVIKDHFRDGFLAGPTLRLMDWVGNAHHGVALPYNYWSNAEWLAAFRDLHWKIEEMQTSLELYPTPASWIFGRKLHFIARLSREDAAAGPRPA
ncbi:MAG TPA: class I SAM-dependent methyltransferase [Candidatus Acidoferrales bacterium]|nr:class I SAM-dependent methyltransferase [Candidatus Acidoferrales bacterium]